MNRKCGVRVVIISIRSVGRERREFALYVVNIYLEGFEREIEDSWRSVEGRMEKSQRGGPPRAWRSKGIFREVRGT